MSPPYCLDLKSIILHGAVVHSEMLVSPATSLLPHHDGMPHHRPTVLKPKKQGLKPVSNK